MRAYMWVLRKIRFDTVADEMQAHVVIAIPTCVGDRRIFRDETL